MDDGGDGRTLLHFAAKEGNSKIVQSLLADDDSAATVNAPDKNGWTAMHCAAANGHSTVVQLLLNAGADLYAKANDGRTAMHLAKEKGHAKVLELLRKEQKLEVGRQEKNG